MGVWRDRCLIYKTGFSGVVIGAIMFVIGFCLPSWAEFHPPANSISLHARHESVSLLGLWQSCTADLKFCAIAVLEDDPGWLKAVRALMCISMFFTVAACIIGMYSNCILKAQFSSDFFNKNMETAAIVAVVFGSFGLIIFATQVGDYHTLRMGRVYWGFIVVCVANAVVGISAFLMLISHRIHLLAQSRRFSHSPFNDSFHAHIHHPHDSPEGGSQMFITTPDGHIDFGPPAYETVVNCIPQDEVAPPPYSQVVKTEQ